MELLQRGAGGDFVARAWEGKTVVCVGGGPGGTQERLEVVRRARARDACRVIVANDMYLACPWADVLYFADVAWWQLHVDGIAKEWPWVRFTAEEQKAALWAFAGQKVTIEHKVTAEHPSLFILKRHGTEGMSDRQDGIHTGGNSGFQQVNIAALSGAKRILLVGYDMRFVGKKTHSHNGHPNQFPEHSYRSYAQMFLSAQAPLRGRGIEVVNCTPGSLIGAFPFGDLERLLPDPRPALV